MPPKPKNQNQNQNKNKKHDGHQQRKQNNQNQGAHKNQNQKQKPNQSPNLMQDQEYIKNCKARVEGILSEAMSFLEQKQFGKLSQKILQISSNEATASGYNLECLMVKLLGDFYARQYAKIEPTCNKIFHFFPEQTNNEYLWKINIISKVIMYRTTDVSPDIPIKALQSVEHPTEVLFDTIFGILPLIQSPKLITLLISALKKPDKEMTAKYFPLLPNTPESAQAKVEFLISKNSSDLDHYKQIIDLFILDQNFEKALEYNQYLPDDDPRKLEVEILFGTDPLEKSEILRNKGNLMFEEWRQNMIDKDLLRVKQSFLKIPNFVNGYLMFLDLIDDNRIKALWCNSIRNTFPKSIKVLTKIASIYDELQLYDECQKTVNMLMPLDHHLARSLLIHTLIHAKRISEVNAMINDDVDLTLKEKAEVDLAMWMEDKNDNRLHEILKLETNKEFAEIKAEALYLLGDRFDAKMSLQLFAEFLKEDKENPMIYAHFGRYLKEVQKSEEKGNFLLKKAVEHGYLADDAVDLYTRDLINENKLEECISLCKKVNTKWSHFRSGLILYRLQRYDEATVELQLHVKKDPSSIEAWNVLANLYLIRGKVMSAAAVNERLKELSKPNFVLQSQLNSIFGLPITLFDKGIQYDAHQENLSAEERKKLFKLEETPILFSQFLRQTTQQIHSFFIFGRQQLVDHLINITVPLVQYYNEKWGKLASVLKECGDFYVESFTSTNNTDYLQTAQVLYMKRCELDKRGESFVDLAMVLNMKGATEQALVVLRRAVKAFPDNPTVWISLGICFAILKKFPYAKHCICVAKNIAADDINMSSIFVCFAAISLLMNESNLAARATDAAFQLNQENSEVWQLKYLQEENNKYSNAVLIYESGATVNAVKALPSLCIQENQIEDALGFAIMSKDRKKIAQAYEACGLYEYAMLFVDDDDKETKERLIVLSKGTITNQDFDSQNPMVKAAHLFGEGKYDEAGALFVQRNDIFGKLGAYACAYMKGNSEKVASAIQKEVKTSDPSYQLLLDSIQIKANPNNGLVYPDVIRSKYLTLIPQFETNYAALTNLYQWEKSKFSKDPELMKLLIVEILKSETAAPAFLNDLSKQLLTLTGSRESILLRALSLYKLRKINESKLYLQQYIVCNPYNSSVVFKFLKELN